MKMKEKSQPLTIEVPESTLEKWQNIVNIIAKLIGVPAALIMRLVKSDIEVLVSSQSSGNPYHPGDHEKFLGSGLYCETAITSNNKLLVPNALADEKWRNNPDIKLNMISYLGFPIYLLDRKPFGTICVLDNKENAYSETYKNLIENFRDIIQYHLELIYMNSMLGENNKTLSDYLEEIKTLRGIVPICSYCKKIKDAEGKWSEVDVYVEKHSEAEFSHSICEECARRFYPDLLKTYLTKS
jgi:transcriptional regulator with GAF, ATPase, and Fis domain